ncbi:hypothetical protein ACTWLI_11125 [Arthrobacter sp. Hor0625]|uniref:hypothetical protein n=1 Tax=Arthrobacter sp. Hor0625 TaxID=3457358 RepID=UPI00403E71FA
MLRQIKVLAEFGAVTTVSYGSCPPHALDHLEVDGSLPSLPQTPAGVLALALRKFRALYLQAPAVKAAAELVGSEEFDLIVANEARALPLAHYLANKMSITPPVWGDMHEWAPEERAHVLSWRLLVKPYMTHVCAAFLPRTRAVSAVNASIAKLYDERFGTRSVVIRNAGPLQDLEPSQMESGRVRLVHSGAAVPGRNLEGLIEAVLLLDDRYSLDLYLVEARDGGKYWRKLRDLSAGSPRIVFHDAVAPDALARTLNAYDLGIFSLPPRTTNHALMLPNKFFDFVQARLGIVFSPSPETSALINTHNLGAITTDYSPESLATAIRSLSESDIAQYKANAHLAASELSSSRDEEVQRGLLRRLLITVAE